MESENKKERQMELEHMGHEHPLAFIRDRIVTSEEEEDCFVCEKAVEGWSDGCNECKFYLHKGCTELDLLPLLTILSTPNTLSLSPQNHIMVMECGELSLEIIHPYDRKHPLTLLPKRPLHPEECSCCLCKTQWSGFVYSCSLCHFDLSIEDFPSPRTITHASHEHPWSLISRQMSFICDFCGTTGDHSPYLCATCDLLVHKKCISLPRKIMLTRHLHVLSLSYPFQQDEDLHWTCRICYGEVDTRYGNYFCSASNCNYIAHSNCATNKAIWDRTIISEDYNEGSIEALHEFPILITDVVEQISIGEQMVASEIKHAYHDHNLTLTFTGEINDDNQCDGCMLPISTPFYSCDQCKFFLHKDCAELPRTMQHPFHKHLLTLTNSHGRDEYSYCNA
ncbi:uncharacterized protein LOC120139101 [Hibiscus syriacus]|uniref:uncharacterized protein LOC120139101 n=1 Tax=Hibiscus syriacus TaxID=106335 RepID=UPI001921747F|nr:uncharacterized protein LOC120139101 [Hibiscus syriacus]